MPVERTVLARYGCQRLSGGKSAQAIRYAVRNATTPHVKPKQSSLARLLPHTAAAHAPRRSSHLSPLLSCADIARRAPLLEIQASCVAAASARALSRGRSQHCQAQPRAAAQQQLIQLACSPGLLRIAGQRWLASLLQTIQPTHLLLSASFSTRGVEWAKGLPLLPLPSAGPRCCRPYTARRCWLPPLPLPPLLSHCAGLPSPYSSMSPALRG